MTESLTPEQVFDAALRIQVREKKNLEINFSPGQVRIFLPPKRELVVACAVPMSAITAVLARMEQDHLIGTKQRGEMWAAPEGNRIIAGLLAGTYRNEAAKILGPVALDLLLRCLGETDETRDAGTFTRY